MTVWKDHQYTSDEISLVMSQWGTLPPTKDDIESTGATIVAFERNNSSYVGEYNINGSVDAFTKISPSYDSTIVQHKHLARVNDRMVDASWASVLYIVRVNAIRVANILRVRKTNTLIVFNVFGEPVKSIPTRKHIKPTYVQKQLNMTVLPTVECVQLDSIRASNHNSKGEIERKINVHAPNGMRMVDYDYMYKVDSQESIDTKTVLDTEIKNPDFEGAHTYPYKRDDNIPIRAKEDRDKEYRDRLDSTDISKPTPKPIRKRTKRDLTKTFSEIKHSK